MDENSTTIKFKEFIKLGRSAIQNLKGFMNMIILDIASNNNMSNVISNRIGSANHYYFGLQSKNIS